MISHPHRVFVYGTLKRGGTNHHFIRAQKFIDFAHSQPGYTLYQVADYPGLVLDTTDHTGVSGEIWEVDAACLQALDHLEGVATGLYRRIPIALAAPYAAWEIETYLYLLPIIGAPHLGSTWPVQPIR